MIVGMTLAYRLNVSVGLIVDLGFGLSVSLAPPLNVKESVSVEYV